MRPVAPRTLVFGGRVLAGGLWFDRSLLGEDEARRRVLRWAGRAREVFDVGGGYLVVLGQPEPVYAERCPGSPVVEQRGRWLAAPVRASELPPDASAPCLVRVRGGRVEVLPLPATALVDVASWLAVDDWTVVPTRSLGHVPPAARPTLWVEPQAGNLPKLLGSALPAKDPEFDAILEALAARKNASPTPESRPGGLLQALSAWLDRRFGGEAPTTALPASKGTPGKGGSSAQSGRPARAPTEPPAPPGRFRQWLSRLAARSRLGQIIGRRQAEYLERTLEHFEQGRWDEALRHAIPFSSLPGAPKPPSLSVPSPREELKLSASQGPGPTTSMHLGEDLFARFRELYARAARELEQQGRIEEAAYVLFELLGQDEEGVALLERHGRYALAAAMAEGRGHPPGRIIRLLFLAGQAARAIIVARRTGAFADAIERLERKEPQLALRLRLLWADRLASAGEYAAAVDAVRSIPQARSLVRAWVDRAIALGGHTASTMLPHKLALWPEDPEARDQVREAVTALLDSDDDEAPALRHSLGSAWAIQGRSAQPTWGALASDITRQLMIDGGRHGKGGPPPALLRALDDPVLRHDISGLVTPRVSVPPPRSPVIEAHERGLTAVEDALLLPSGRLLLALGELGMRLVDARGKTLRSYEHPAFRLVMADSAAQAIALYRRGQTWTLRRIDLATGRAEHWCDARFDRFAHSYDGAGWYLTADDALALVDAQGPGFEALWRVGGLPSAPAALARSRSHVSLAFVDSGQAQAQMQKRVQAQIQTQTQNQAQVWTYEMTTSGPILRSRRLVDLPVVADDQLHLMVLAEGTLLGHRQGSAFCIRPNGFNVQSQLETGDALMALPDHALLLRAQMEGIVLRRLPYDSLVPAETIVDLRGTHALHVHPDSDGRLLVVDDRGRVVSLDAQAKISRLVRV